MAELLEQIAEFFETLVATAGYPGVFLVMFFENLFPPVPTDPLLPFAGILAARGEMRFVLVWVIAVTGAVSGSLVLYGIGIWGDEHVIRGFIRRWGRYLDINEDALDRALGLFRKHGAPVILVGRTIPVLRSAVSLTAGISRMHPGRFLFFTTLHSVIAVGFYIYIGYLLGENWRVVIDAFDRLQGVILVIVIAGVVIGVVLYARRWMRRRHNPGHVEHDAIGGV